MTKKQVNEISLKINCACARYVRARKKKKLNVMECYDCPFYVDYLNYCDYYKIFLNALAFEFTCCNCDFKSNSEEFDFGALALRSQSPNLLRKGGEEGVEGEKGGETPTD